MGAGRRVGCNIEVVFIDRSPNDVTDRRWFDELHRLQEFMRPIFKYFYFSGTTFLSFIKLVVGDNKFLVKYCSDFKVCNSKKCCKARYSTFFIALLEFESSTPVDI